MPQGRPALEAEEARPLRADQDEVEHVVDSYARAGSKKRPFFRVVVTEARVAREGSFVEILGTYNPRTKPAMVEINKERVDALDQAGRAAVGFGAHAARASHLTRDRGVVRPPRRRARRRRRRRRQQADRG